MGPMPREPTLVRKALQWKGLALWMALGSQPMLSRRKITQMVKRMIQAGM